MGRRRVRRLRPARAHQLDRPAERGTHPYTTSPTNSGPIPLVTAAYDTVLDFAPWRTNPNFVGAILVAADLPPKVLGDYHIFDTTSPGVQHRRGEQGGPAYAAAAGDPERAPHRHRRPAAARPGRLRHRRRRDPLAHRRPLDHQDRRRPRRVTQGGTTTYTIVVTQRGPEHRDRARPSRTRSRQRSPSPAGRAPPTAGSSCTATGSGNNRTGAAHPPQRRQRDLHGDGLRLRDGRRAP